MGMEVSCGQCQGRLVVETPGTVVACPHCGAHLMAPEMPVETPPSESPVIKPAEESVPNNLGPSPSPELSSKAPILLDWSDNDIGQVNPSTDTMVMNRSSILDLAGLPIESTSSENIHDSVDHVGHHEFLFDLHEHVSNDPLDLTGAKTRVEKGVRGRDPAKIVDELPPVSPEPEFRAEPVAERPPEPPPPREAANPFQFTATEKPIAPDERNEWPVFPGANSLLNSERETGSTTRQTSSSSLLLIIGTYASLLTIYLIYITYFARTHQLESLPDLKTVQQEGGRAAVPRPENELPAGHVMRLGQSQRFGNIRVTALKVTRGPIEFVHFTGDTDHERAPSEPVLKLWLRFENDSDRQTVVPIDPTLMYFRRVLKNRVAAFNAIFREQDRKDRSAKVYYPFDRIAIDSEWQIVGQRTNQALSPGEMMTTFIPSEEQIEDLSGEIVWRVHFRKGHGPLTGNGVTTLIDVHFNTDEIRPDAA